VRELARDRIRQLLRRRRAARARDAASDGLTREWFPEQRAFYQSRARRTAALCSRRAGKSRGGNADMVRLAAKTPHGRFLYINETRAEAKRLAWYGARGDGMASLAERNKLPVELNLTELTIRFPAIDSWIYLLGADDEAGVRKALGVPYHKVWWDEAQKIPPKLTQTILEVLMPTLLDYGGQFQLTGTPSRQMNGLFYDVTRGDAKAAKGWDVHRWTLLDNPFFGATREERFTRGLLGLQELFGGADVAPLDSPIMRREGSGQWTHEDAAYVYKVHQVAESKLYYAPARVQPGGVTLNAIGDGGGPFEVFRLPDLQKALADLPGWGNQEYWFALGADIGFHPDPFAFVLWAWSAKSAELFEVASWRQTHLDSNQQAAILRWVCDQIPVGIVVADASNPARPAVAGWSKGWQDRYGIAVQEAKKADKYGAIDVLNADMARGLIRLREGGLLYEEMAVLQWASVVSSSGRLVEDPTLVNDCCDAGLYAHRTAYHHRFRPDEVKPPPGSDEALLVEETELESILEEALYGFDDE
jgi:hypothetical protein